MTLVSTDRLYTRHFFQAFAASCLFMTCVSLQYHFAKYLEFRGCSVATSGLIVGLGSVGPLLLRLHIGKCIDRFGCRPTWFVGTVAVALAMVLMRFTDGIGQIVVLRTVFQVAVSAVMTTVAVFAAQIAPPLRRAESIGTIGLAGFLGTSLGPLLGDAIFKIGGTDTIMPYEAFFGITALCSLAACAVMMLMTLPAACGPGFGQSAAVSPGDGPKPLSTIQVILRHWPGPILLVSAVFSMVACLNQMYLERLADAAGFRNIKVFYLVYCPTAIAMRLLFRRLPEILGRRGTLLMGMSLHTVGLLALLGVKAESHLILPALLMGSGHCFIFPSMVDLAADRLPPQYRGTGTALAFAAGDLGQLVGFVCLGQVIAAFGYDAAILVMAAAVAFGAVVFAIRGGSGR